VRELMVAFACSFVVVSLLVTARTVIERRGVMDFMPLAGLAAFVAVFLTMLVVFG
jgi:hypothetical protein